PASPGWVVYRQTVVPNRAATGLSLFLYSDAQSAGSETVNDYADVRAIELSALPSLAVVGKPEFQLAASQPLLMLHTGYSDAWSGPRAPHILVNGLIN